MTQGSTGSRVGILGTGAYLPERVMTNEEWAEHVDTSDEWITSRTGIKRRRLAAPEETTADLAVAAAREALADAGVGADEIDELIVATDTPEVYIPDTASFVQQRLGLLHVPAYDLGGSGCAGFVLAIDVACSRVRGTGRRALVVGVELLTRLMNWRDRHTCVLFGDGAGAAVVGTKHLAAELLASTAGTDGSRADILQLELGGTRLPFSLERARQGLHHDIVMQGREVYREAVKRMSEAAGEVLRQAGRAAGELALVIPHQANIRIIEAVRRALDLPREKVFVNVHEYGNTGSASVPIALAEARQQGRIAPGDLVLLTAFGAGFHWAAALLRF